MAKTIQEQKNDFIAQLEETIKKKDKEIEEKEQMIEKFKKYHQEQIQKMMEEFIRLKIQLPKISDMVRRESHRLQLQPDTIKPVKYF